MKLQQHSLPQYKSKVVLYFVIFFALSLVVFFCQNFFPDSEFLGSIFIPDVVNMSDTFDNIHGSPGGISIFATGLAGMYFLYYIPWIIHPALCLLLNLVFVYYSLKLICDIFIVSKMAGANVCLAIILNPYLYLAVTGPNKEIPLIWGTLYIVKCIFFKPKNYFIKAALLSVAIIFIRDGYGIILLLTIFIFSRKIAASLMWKIGLLVSFICAVAFELVLSNLSIFARNVLVSEGIGQQKSALIGNFLSSSNPIFSVVKQITRMLYNGLTLSVFPALTTVNNNIYLIGWAYWFYGILLSIGMAGCLYVLAKKRSKTDNDKQRIKLAGLILFLWSTISISLYLQPRYLMTVLPLALGLMISLTKNRKILICSLMVFFSVFVITVYSLIGAAPAKATASDLVPKTASFLINPADR